MRGAASASNRAMPAAAASRSSALVARGSAAPLSPRLASVACAGGSELLRPQACMQGARSVLRHHRRHGQGQLPRRARAHIWFCGRRVALCPAAALGLRRQTPCVLRVQDSMIGWEHAVAANGTHAGAPVVEAQLMQQRGNLHSARAVSPVQRCQQNRRAASTPRAPPAAAGRQPASPRARHPARRPRTTRARPPRARPKSAAPGAPRRPARRRTQARRPARATRRPAGRRWPARA